MKNINFTRSTALCITLHGGHVGVLSGFSGPLYIRNSFAGAALAQTTNQDILDALRVSLLDPVFYQRRGLSQYEGLIQKARTESVHILLFPKYDALHEEPSLLTEWEKSGRPGNGAKALEESDRPA
jgi:hypothetical protein